jgi:hypothetical protein
MVASVWPESKMFSVLFRPKVSGFFVVSRES